AVIDGVKLTILNTFSMASEPSGLAISADGNTLFVAEKGATKPEIGVIDLDALVAKSSLPAPFPGFDIAAGTDNRVFMTSWGHFFADVVQLDGSTGDLLAPFPSGISSGLLQAGPDRKMLYLAGSTVFPPPVYSIDVSSDVPAVLQQTPFNLVQGIWQNSFTMSPDGTTLCAPGGADLPQGQTMLRIPTNDLTATDGGYILRNGGTSGGAIIFSPDDKTVLISDQNEAPGVDIFDAETQ